MTRTDKLANAYRFHRLNGASATAALTRAHLDMTAGTTRYPYEHGSVVGAARDGARWVERPQDAGLRFVGWSDELQRHTAYSRNLNQGWYSRDADDGEVYRGAVWQLPARNGRPIYVVGYREGEARGRYDWRDTATGQDTGAGLLNLGSLIYGDDARGEEPDHRDAAIMADGFAERHAETSREYFEAWQAGSQWQSLGETVAQYRTQALAILKDRRGAVGSATLCGVIRDKVESLVEMIADARRERRDLADRFDYSPTRKYWGNQADLAAAFHDGAGIA